MQGRVEICGLHTRFEPLCEVATVVNIVMSVRGEG